MTIGPFIVGQIPGKPQTFVIFDAQGNQQDLSGYSQIQANLCSPPDGAVSIVGTCSVGDPTNNPGKVSLVWGSLSPFNDPGLYSIRLEMDGANGVKDYTGWQDFNVDPAEGSSIPCWASVADVASITRKSITDEDLVQAQIVINLVTNRTPEVSAFVLKRDLTWLKYAVAYQAVWMLAQPDLYERSAGKDVSQDGVSFSFTSKAAVYLGPLAIRALKNISWMRSRSLRMQTPFIDRGGAASDPMIDDALWDWNALSIVEDPGFSTPWWNR